MPTGIFIYRRIERGEEDHDAEMFTVPRKIKSQEAHPTRGKSRDGEPDATLQTKQMKANAKALGKAWPKNLQSDCLMKLCQRSHRLTLASTAATAPSTSATAAPAASTSVTACISKSTTAVEAAEEAAT